MVSPGNVSEMAFEMVLQACWGDLQSLLSPPCTPSTYHVLLAVAVAARTRKKAPSSRVLRASRCLMTSPSAKGGTDWLEKGHTPFCRSLCMQDKGLSMLS